MNNLNSSLKKFVSNKNTVTLLGVLLCVIVLYIGYNYRINEKTKLTRVPYANQTIQPKTAITSDMISYMSVPASFLVGTYYKSADAIIGKYSNYNTMIAEGSLFYTDLVVDASSLPDSSFIDVPDNYTVINYGVSMESTYANSMMPKSLINIYFKATDEDGTIMFGKFISNVEILDVKDAEGQHVFENSSEARTPAYMLFALPEDMHLLFRKALYLSKEYEVEIILVPNTQTLKEEDTVNVSSEDIKGWIEDKTKMVDVTTILTETESKATTETNTSNNTNTNTKTTTNNNTNTNTTTTSR